MRIIVVIIFLYAAGIVSLTAGKHPEGVTSRGRRTLTWYRLQIESFKEDATALLRKIEKGEDVENVQHSFSKARLSYKKLEAMVEYFSPLTAKTLNGPNLDEVEADERDVVEAPEGFQVMEEMMFPSFSMKDTAGIRKEAVRMLSNIKRLQRTAELLTPTDVQLFDAMRQEITRITALGISGFDSPIACGSLPEARAALLGVKTIWSFYKDDIADHALTAQTRELFADGDKMLEGADFTTFDRLTFISKYLNPIAANLNRSREMLKIGTPAHPSFVAPSAANVFAADAFNTGFYAADQQAKYTPGQTELGKKLFYDPVLSENNVRSCASCHKPELAFTDGLPVAASLNGSAQMRNTPTLLNAALQSAQFYDLRVAYLEDQVTDVVNNPAEMHGSLENAVVKIKQDEAYRRLFSKAFGDSAVIHSHQVKLAIAAYIRSLTSLNSRFDDYMRGNKTAVNKAEARGFNLFMGKAKCGTCHFTPLFNGNVPPRFEKTEAEVIGVPAAADVKTLDNDEGKYNLYKVALHRHAFKTPTLRNIVLTAPYMHNGIYSTLDEVMEFYNNGGGAGLGIQLENQTLPTDSLHLSQREKEDVIAFLHTLTDAPGAKK